MQTPGNEDIAEAMSDLTDKELPGYLRAHSRTPVGLVHRSHFARLHDLAGQASDADLIRSGKEWWRPAPEYIDPLADEADRRMSVSQ